MLQDFFLNFSTSLNSTSVIFIWFFQILFCYFSILGALRFFGKMGIYVYVAIAIILANIQVLKVIEFPFFPEPMALGTILFISIFLCTDILNEYFDNKFSSLPPLEERLKPLFLSGFKIIDLQEPKIDNKAKTFISKFDFNFLQKFPQWICITLTK